MKFSSSVTSYTYDDEGRAARMITYGYDHHSHKSMGTTCGADTLNYAYSAAPRLLSDAQASNGGPWGKNFVNFHEQYCQTGCSQSGNKYYYGHRYYVPESGRWVSI